MFVTCGSANNFPTTRAVFSSKCLKLPQNNYELRNFLTVSTLRISGVVI